MPKMLAKLGAFVASIVFAFPVCASDDLPRGRILKHFENIVFPTSGPLTNTLYKWEGPMNVVILGNFLPLHFAEAARALEFISKVSNTTINIYSQEIRIPRGQSAHVILVLDSDIADEILFNNFFKRLILDFMEGNIKRFKFATNKVKKYKKLISCFRVIRFNQNEIDGVIIFARTNNNNIDMKCIYSKLLQVFGLFGKPDKEKSVMDDNLINRNLSQIDIKALDIFFSKSINHLDTKKTALSAARRFVYCPAPEFSAIC